MRPVRFVHAADLHLDTAFSGLARQVSAELSRRLHEATFIALDRLVALCEKEKPDFLILAGDTYNQEDLSLRAQLAVRNACERLGRAGIPVFLAHGNHDPLSSRLKTLDWPDNVKVFGESVESFPVFGADSEQETLAIVHGISHSGPKESRNLAAWFQRNAHKCPQIGVLHTSMGTVDGESVYAPASVEDLAASGLDYWALGHVHEYSVVSREPLAQYPGAAQGLHVNETGPHGCVLVTLSPEGDGNGSWSGVRADSQFFPLAPVGWQIFELDLADLDKGADDEQAESIPRLERHIREKLGALSATVWPGCDALVLRLRLTGRTALDGELRRKPVQDELAEALRQDESGEVEIWVKDIQVETRPLFDRKAALEREDLLGEVLRQADLWRNDESLFLNIADEALGDLFLKGKSRKAQERPDRAALLSLLDEAERICADYLENN